jgi:hypothetical protein
MNPRLGFVVLGSFYFFVLLVSYLLGFLYPFFTPYGWLLIPVVANFFFRVLSKRSGYGNQDNHYMLKSQHWHSPWRAECLYRL